MRKYTFCFRILELVYHFRNGVDGIDRAERSPGADDAQVCGGNEDVVRGVDEADIAAKNIESIQTQTQPLHPLQHLLWAQVEAGIVGVEPDRLIGGLFAIGKAVVEDVDLCD